jgi:hypothetical protein
MATVANTKLGDSFFKIDFITTSVAEVTNLASNSDNYGKFVVTNDGVLGDLYRIENNGTLTKVRIRVNLVNTLQDQITANKQTVESGFTDMEISEDTPGIYTVKSISASGEVEEDLDISSYVASQASDGSETIIGAGTNVSIGGTGTAADPYIVNSGAGQPATETDAGILEIATQAEVETGVDDVRAITPLKLNTWWGTSYKLVDIIQKILTSGQALSASYTSLTGSSIVLTEGLHEVVYSQWFDVGSLDFGEVSIFLDGVEVGGTDGYTNREFGAFVTTGTITSRSVVHSMAQITIVGIQTLTVQARETTGASIISREGSVSIKKYVLG